MSEVKLKAGTVVMFRESDEVTVPAIVVEFNDSKANLNVFTLAGVRVEMNVEKGKEVGQFF